MPTQAALPRILYIYPGFVPPPREEKRNKHYFVSAVAKGDILLPVWWKSSSFLTERLGVSPDDPFIVGAFRYHFFFAYRYPPIVRDFLKLMFYLVRGARLLRKQRYDAIICYGTNAPGIAAVLLGAWFRVPFIAEIPGVPSKAYVHDEAEGSGILRLRKRIADAILGFVLRRAKHARLLFPTQLAGYRAAERLPTSVFHEFVPVGLIPNRGEDGRFVYFLGSPFHLKGVDILLRAFKKIEPLVPDVCLKVVGHCAELRPFEEIAGGSARIEFLPGKPHPEAMELMTRCSVFVLPSRTEAMGCVMLEAMAAGKPVIGSAVDGIPHYLKDGVNGMLFPSENSEKLAEKLLTILSSPELARSLGDEGRRKVSSTYSEEAYAQSVAKMLRDVIGGRA